MKKKSPSIYEYQRIIRGLKRRFPLMIDIQYNPFKRKIFSNRIDDNLSYYEFDVEWVQDGVGGGGSWCAGAWDHSHRQKKDHAGYFYRVGEAATKEMVSKTRQDASDRTPPEGDSEGWLDAWQEEYDKGGRYGGI